MTLGTTTASFLDKINSFLIDHHLEDEQIIIGYTEEEIKDFESLNAFNFPEDYRLFLKYYAKGGMRFFLGDTFRLDKIESAKETAAELLSDANDKLSNDHIIISQWQGYNFHYLQPTSQETLVCIYMEGNGTIEKIKFRDWIKKMILDDLTLRKMDTPEIINTLNEIK